MTLVFPLAGAALARANAALFSSAMSAEQAKQEP
jgi:hypothetical protein